MTTPEILEACDEKASTWLPILEEWAVTQLAAHGAYWQGLKTHTVTPADGEEERPDVDTKHPTDQSEPWPPHLRNELLPFAAVVDVYDGPPGLGYTVTLEVVIEGQPWRRTESYGPESWREQPWAEVPPSLWA
jgi:hypothetical protein